MSQSCTLCSYCTIHTGTNNSHIVQQHPSCAMTDEKHVPPPRCTCIKITEPPPPTWIHSPSCPIHP